MSKDSAELIIIDEYSKTPKYRQIISSITNSIQQEKLKIDDKLPSVNKILIEFDISRDTIVKAYDYLKANKIIKSVPGKGYYVMTNDISTGPRVLLLFNKLSAHKKIIYDAFSMELGEQAAIDFYIYNNDFKLFKRILQEKEESDYTHFVIISHFLEGGNSAIEVINEIPKSKLIILDKKIDGLTGEYASVYQDFEKDLYQVLTEMIEKLSNYERLKLIFPNYTYHPESIKNGFQKFCDEFAFKYSIINDVNTDDINEGDAYINLMEDDLVQLIKRCREQNLTIGKQIGIISYNETLLKEILLDGITTISTDFELLGKTAASFIKTKTKAHIPNPFHVKYRASL
ncbi:GntR family transcriptional regulator [Portibacter lacus]|uniref:Transcriptional regulator n=1 Tax=Portibacter lacus TaxID=1099794 RepID=A0AA37SQ76_9BACT|nr:GntR family transcriptional regulator [Portibacter lacus]GLR18976.1 transcriptional regulator [Portibacter lacus]